MGCSFKVQKSHPKIESTQIKLTISDVQLDDSNLSIKIEINNCQVDHEMVFKRNEIYADIQQFPDPCQANNNVETETICFRSQQLITKNQQCNNYLSARQINTKFLMDRLSKNQSQSPVKGILKPSPRSQSSAKNLSQKKVVFGGQTIQYIAKQPKKGKRLHKITMDLLDEQF